MLTFILAFVVMAADEPATPVRLPPPTSLSLDVAEAVGARIQRLALASDATISAAERTAIEAALSRTGLFTLTDAAAATASLAVTRVDAAIILASVTGADGVRLWVGRIAWPAVDPAPIAVAAAGTDSDATYKDILQYKRDRVRLVPTVRGWTATPFPYGWFDLRRPYQPFPWDLGYTQPVPMPTAPNDWLLMRGAAEVLDELDFARLTQDEALGQRIEEARFWPQLYWAIGFSGAALTGVGAGVWLSGFEDRDTRAVGISLITMGAVSAVMALMFPAAGPSHILSVPETQDKVDTYNEELRTRLGLTAEDLARLMPSE